MNKQDILVLFQYNQWTDKKILEAVAKVTPEQFLASSSFPHGGLRSTLVHALFASWIWHQRWEGVSPSQRFKPDDFPTFEALRTRWMEEDKSLMKFVENVTDERLNSLVSYKTTDGTPHAEVLWQLMA